MARLADDYINFPTRNINNLEGDIPEIWRIAKPKKGPLIYRLADAFKVMTGEYDAVYYHADIKEMK